MKLQDVADHCQEDSLRIANSHETVEGDQLNDNHAPATASEIQVESQAAPPGVGAFETVDDVTPKGVFESINQSGDVKESQPGNLQADPCESIGVDTKVGDKQILESSDGLERNADCAPQPTEIQNVILENESVADSGNTPVVLSDSEIHVTISEEAPAHEGDNGGEKVFEVKESQPCNSQADSCESLAVDTNCGDKQILESSDVLEGNAGCAAQPTEIQNVTLEDESVAVSDNMPEARLDSKILVTVSEEAPPHEGDNGGEKVFEFKESQPFNLQAGPCESLEVDVNFGDKQILESSDGLEGNADCAPQPTEIQNVALEDESVAVSDNTSEVQPDSKILVTISEEAPLHEGEIGGEKDFEDTRTKVLPEPKEIQDIITELCQNGQFEVEPELRRTEESGKESVCGPFCKESESCSPVLSVNDDSVSDRKECYQNIVKRETELDGEDLSEEATSKLLPEPDENNDDITVVYENGNPDVAYGLGSEESGTQSVGEPSVLETSYALHSETPYALHPSSSISNTPVPPLKVLEPEIDLGRENKHAVAEVCENGHFEVDLGLGTEEPGTGSVGEPSSEENENHSPVLPSNHVVLERNESNQHIDDSERSSELHPSSSISITPIVSSSCVKPETGERPDQCIENAPDIYVSKEHDVDQEASSRKGVVEVQLFENFGPKNEVIDALAVESVKNGYYITKDKKLEIKSCVPDATMTVIDQAAQIENSTGGDTNISSPEKAARLESTSLNVDGYSCSDAHSSIEEIHGTEPILGTTDSEREMTSLHGDDLDSKNEIVFANVKSNDILTVVSNTESDFKPENSSSIFNTPIVVSSCVKPESDIGEMLGQSSDNVPDTDVLHRLEVDQEASFCEEIGEVQLLEDVRPESDALGVENGHYITHDKKLEIISCVPDATITVIDQAAQIDNSAGGDTNFSSPVKAARLENKTTTSVKVDDFSCSDAYSSIEDIHGTEPALDITDSEREMTTVHGGDLESKNEIVLANVKSNDILTVVLNAESDFKQENSSSIGNRNMSCSNDSRKVFELHPSPSITNTPIVVSGCVKPEMDLGEKPGQSSDDVSDINILQRHEVDQEASSCKENGEVQFLEDVRPESEDLDALGIESVENGYYITEDKKLEIKSCVPDATITAIHQAAEIENSAGGDTNLSSPGNIARLENMAATTDNVDDYSCSEGLSSVEYIHGTELVLGITDPERKTTTFHGDSKNEIVLVNVKSNGVPTVVSKEKSDFEQEKSSGIGIRNVSSSDVFASDGDLSGPVFDDNLSNLLVGIVDMDIENKEDNFSGEDVNMNENLIFQERPDVVKPNVTLAEISDVAARNEHDMGSDSLMRPFRFLVKLPRFDDTIIREQVRQAQLLVEEKTRLRDAFRLEIVNYRLNCREHASRYEAARDEARASKRAVRSKRAEIDSLQTLINKVKNALSVEDIDARIVNLEHMIGHETLLLKEEKQFIREIKQLKQLREQLSSNIGRQDEVQHALNNQDQIEGSLKALKKELDGLKECVLKAEAVARAVEKIYEGESRKLKEVQAQFEAADNVRQEAYEHMQSLRREMYEKNQQFRMYKRNAVAAYDHATKRETEALHNLCFNQVESTMELWNKDPEFRKEYVRCNMRSTVRRLGTLDGRSLGLGEKPEVVSNSVLGGVDRLDHRPRNPSSELAVEILQQEGQEKHNEVALSDEDSKVKEVVVKSLEAKTLNQGKVHLGNGFGGASGSDIANTDVREEEHLPNKEELELARKAEELRKEELKEQRRLEEKAKALEALERKKKNAEKAQMRAELRAQKEAEQREKEKEKRLRKKERKKATTSEASDGDSLGQTIAIAKSERVIEPIKEPEIKETSAAAVSKRSQKPTKQSKTKSTIPPPLRNRGRKRLQQWIWGIVTILLLVIIFIVTNVGFSSKLSSHLRRPGNA